MTPASPSRVRRTLLYMPGDSRRKIEKAAGLDVDSVCLDLEDGVAASQKAAARETVRRALAELDFGGSEVLVRLNPFGSGGEADDLAAAIAGHPDGIVLPKVESIDALRWLDAQVTGAEQGNRWPPGAIGLIAMVETARGIVNLKEICGASSRLQALVFGAEDLAGDIGATRTADAWEVFYARSAVVTHAAAFGLQAIDMVFLDYTDLDGLAREAAVGARLGYSGKQAIHPAQVAPIHSAFTPTATAIAHARRVVGAAQAQQSAGFGAFALDGRMVDAPIVKAAEVVLARARAAGIDA